MTQKQERYALNDAETLEQVVSCLNEYIPIPTQGNCNQQTIFEILVRALRVAQSPTEGNHTVGAGLTASQRDSIENTSKTLNNAPSSNDIRYHLEKYDNLEALESQLNQALQSRLPSRICQGHPQVAIDHYLIPYYGNPSLQEEPYIYRSQAKNGESNAYGVVSLRRQPANPKGRVLILGTTAGKFFMQNM